MTLTKTPETPQFMAWWYRMLTTVASCHAYPQEALKFYKKCEIRPCDDEAIDNPPWFFRSLDARWSAAIDTIVSGAIAANITLFQQKVMGDGDAKLISARRKDVIIR